MMSEDTIPRAPMPTEPARAGAGAWLEEGPVRFVLGATTFLLAFLLWEAAVEFFKVPEFVIPKPTVALSALAADWRIIIYYSWITSIEILLGFLAGAIGGGLLAIAVHRYALVAAALNPLIVFFQIIPKIALAPIFLLWFGFGLAPKVLLVAIIAFFPVTLNMIAGLVATSADLGHLVQSVGGTRSQYLWRVQVPNALPHIFAGLKIAMTFSVIGAVVGEFTGGSEGLGYLILFSSSQVKTPLLFAALFAIAVLGLLMYYAIVVLEHWVIPWERHSKQHQTQSIQWQS
jgi:NitT/TauT family transport system permease protein